MITAKEMSIWVGNRELLHDLNFTVNPHTRVALVGANGAGKTTLLNTFKLDPKQRIEQFGQSLEIWDARIAWVDQEVPNTDQIAIDYVMLGDRNYAFWSQQLEQALANHDNDLVAQANAKLDELDAWTLKSRASIILAGLGFTTEQTEQPVNSLSGGWRIRLNLARALLMPSDMLLLDEPTNHLDIDAIYWLETYLKGYRGTIVFISHDLEFMDNLAQYVLHIDNGTIFSYTGNYSSFVNQRSVRLEVQQKQFEQQQKHIAHVQRFIDRFRYKDSKAKQAQSKIKYLERMQRIDPVVIGSPFNFRFAESQRLPSVLATLRSVSLGYVPGKPVLQKVNFSLLPGMRIGLLGLNGAGKSTLIKAFAGELQAHDGVGTIELNPLVHMGYFNQYVVDKLDTSATPMQLMRRLDDKITEEQARGFLGGFNFRGDKVFEVVEQFSGGEKSRLALALIVYQKPNLLLLDEPTNHLDLEMRQALATALQEFQGSLIVVSHDRFLLSAVAEDFYLVYNGRVEPFEGDLDDYHNWVINIKSQEQKEANARATAQRQEQSGTVAPVDTSSAEDLSPAQLLERLKQNTRLERELHRKLLPLRQQQNKLLQQTEELQAKLDAIQAAFTDPEVFSNASKMLELNKDEATYAQQLEELEEQWLLNEEELQEQTNQFLLANRQLLLS